MIYYLWPLVLVILTPICPGERFCIYAFCGAFLGFAGVYYFLTERHEISALSTERMWAYFLALSSAFSWIGYCLFIKVQKIPPQSLPICYLLIALISGGLHLIQEETVIPTFFEGGMLVGIGAAIQGLSLVLWIRSARGGHLKILSVIAYLIPLGSVGLLVALDFAEMTMGLMVGALLVTLGSLTVSIGQLREKVSVQAKSEDLSTVE